jgi:hypothetical protein
MQQVRLLESTAKVGDNIALHSHPDTVVYIVESGKRRFASLDGTLQQQAQQLFEAG